MHWNRFCQILIETDQKLKQITLDLPQYRSFLKKSSMVISFETIHIPFKKEPTVFDLKSMSELLKDSMFKANLLALNDMIERLEDDQKAMVKQKRTEGLRELTEKLASAKKELINFPLKELEVADIDIQIIFPSVNEAIQTIKKHPLVNRDKTCFCRACIRIYLF